MTTPLPARRRRLAPALTYLSLVVASLVVSIPLVVVFLTSLKTSEEVTDGGALSLPGDWLNFDNYVTAFTDGRCCPPSPTPRRHPAVLHHRHW